MKINPRCKQDFTQVYINTEGYVMPCCWIGNHPFLQDFFDFLGTDAEQTNLKNLSLNEILKSAAFQKIESSWDSETPFRPCRIMCQRKYSEDQNLRGDNEIATLEIEKE